MLNICFVFHAKNTGNWDNLKLFSPPPELGEKIIIYTWQGRGSLFEKNDLPTHQLIGVWVWMEGGKGH